MRKARPRTVAQSRTAAVPCLCAYRNAERQCHTAWLLQIAGWSLSALWLETEQRQHRTVELAVMPLACPLLGAVAAGLHCRRRALPAVHALSADASRKARLGSDDVDA